VLYDLIVSYRISDMMFGVRIEEACKRSSAVFKKSDSLNDLRSIATINDRVLIICDLVSVKSELGAITKLSKEKNWKVFGYYPHIDTDTSTLAHSLGVEYIVSRSALQPKLNALLR
jgi:Ni,Fe-hydrogenase maturation factor